jgi:hypothetical protein
MADWSIAQVAGQQTVFDRVSVADPWTPLQEFIRAGGPTASGMWITNTISVGTSNRAILVPIGISAPTTLDTVSYITGSSVSGNADFGIYTLGGTALSRSGSSSVGATTLTLTSRAIPEVFLDPGWYYLAMSNSATSQFRGVNLNFAYSGACGVRFVSSAHPLPSSLTPGQALQAGVPFLMASKGTV